MITLRYREGRAVAVVVLRGSVRFSQPGDSISRDSRQERIVDQSAILPQSAK